MARHPQWGLIDVYAATIPSFPFTPQLHVNYESTVLPMKDGLPKLKDFPRNSGARERRCPSKPRLAVAGGRKDSGLQLTGVRECCLHPLRDDPALGLAERRQKLEPRKC
jgi:hypothetical protein